MMLTAALLVVGAYLAGGVPSAYVLSRCLRGIDIREYGSGNMGASNVVAIIGKRAGITLGAYDCLVKGLLPVLLARFLDQSIGAQAAVGMAAVIGHCWSPYMGFTGGRGIGTVIGVMLGFAMFYEMAVLGLGMGVVGRILYRDTGFWTFLALLSLPPLTLLVNSLPWQPFLFYRGDELAYMSLAAVPILLLKRLTANWERPPAGYSLARVAFNRVLWDRDVSRKEEWTQRHPVEESAGSRADG